tara:strand:- start:331 stop:867 length:537 start_codon:yes stop_codon:yes gene_type:complete
VQSNYKNKALFLDRDGVINHLVFRNSGFYSPRKLNDFKLYDDIKGLVDFFKEKNFYIIIISNQPDISRKKMTIEELNSIDIFLNTELNIDDIKYSFDSEVIAGGSKKPSPKMIFEAQDKWNINLSKSYFIGDSLSDIECAKNAKVPFILVKRKHNQHINYPNYVDNLNDIQKIKNNII